MRTVLGEFVADLPSVESPFRIRTVSVGPRREILVLVSDEPPEERPPRSDLDAYWARQKLRAEALKHYTIHRLTDGDGVKAARATSMGPSTTTFQIVQPLGDDQFLMVERRAEGREHNAFSYSSDGKLLGSFHAGDGIEDVQVTETGAILVSYFDEGVFGDGGLAQNGLVCLDRNGDVAWEYGDVARQNGLPLIDDCYAVNAVSSEEVWLCYYSAFPLIKLTDGRPEAVWLEQPVRGSSAFAVGRGRALFQGGYRQRDRLLLLRLDTLEVEEIQPVDAEGRPLSCERAVGRGERLYLWTDQAVYAIDANTV